MRCRSDEPPCPSPLSVAPERQIGCKPFGTLRWGRLAAQEGPLEPRVFPPLELDQIAQDAVLTRALDLPTRLNVTT